MAKKRRKRRPSADRKRSRRDASDMAGRYRRSQKYRRRFLTLEQGTNVGRVMPSWSEEHRDFDKKIVTHRGFNIEGESNAPVYCLAYHTDKKCPICAVHAWLEARRDQDDDYAKWAKAIFPKRRHLINWMTAGDEDKSVVKILEVGSMIMAQLAPLLETPGYGDVTDEEDGWEVSIERRGSGFDTKYRLLPIPDSRGPIEVEGWDDLMHDLDAVVNQRIKTRKEIIELLEKNFPQLPIQSICGVSKKGVDQKMAKRKGKKFKAPLDPETKEPLVWVAEESAWGNERTGDLWEFPPPPKSYLVAQEDEKPKKKRKRKAKPEPEEEEEEDEEWDDEEEEDEEEDEEDEDDEEEDEEDEEDEEEEDDEGWDDWDDDEEEEEEEEEEPKPKKSKKKKGKKAKVKEEPAKKKRGKKAKKEEPKKRGKKKAAKKGGKKKRRKK
jgi:hypothetical protein